MVRTALDNPMQGMTMVSPEGLIQNVDALTRSLHKLKEAVIILGNEDRDVIWGKLEVSFYNHFVKFVLF